MSKRQRRRHEKQRRHERLVPSKRQVALGASLITGATLASGGTAHAVDFTVNNTNDTGGYCPTASTCTLRQAIAGTNLSFETDTITFASSLSGSTINLTADLPNIQYESVYIYGPPGGATIDGQDSYSIFTANRAGGYVGATLDIEDLILTGGSATNGGAINSPNSSLFVSDSVISGNSAATGGGINSNAYTSIQGSTISYNLANNGAGLAGSYPFGNIGHSTVSGNFAVFNGGGFYMYKPDIDMANSTIYNNTAYGLSGSTGYGGGISTFSSYNIGNYLHLYNDTVAGNYAYAAGGGVFETGGYQNPTLYNTIAADNVSGLFGSSQDDLTGGPFSGSFDLVEDGGAALSEDIAGSNITGVDPQLQTLAFNGGPTATQAPLASSPVVDKGANAGYTDDQRYLTRPVDFSTIANSAAGGADGSDIGAFELQTLTDSQPSPGGGGGGGAGAATPPPKCKGKTATIFARPGLARTFNGTAKKDVIVGTSGKDTINARGGNDLVCAKGGKDTVRGAGGKDKLYGQGGADKLVGGAGNDKLVGGGGKDKLLGKGGSDTLVGSAGDDTCVGGAGKDTLKSC
jgi:hypothetical protein